MSTDVIKIVEEEFKRARTRIVLRRDPRADLDFLEARLKERIRQELIEIPESEPCCFCGKTETECTGSGFDDGIEAHDFTPGGIVSV